MFMNVPDTRLSPARVSERHPRGFTLIELLVVVAIISLLVSILMPSLSKAKELAKQAICMSTQRQMGVGLQMYVAENAEYKPAPFLDKKYSSLWYFALGGAPSDLNDDAYLPHPRGGTDFWRCPSYDYPLDRNITYGMSRSHGYDIPFRMEYTTAFQSFNTNDPNPNGQLASSPSMVFVFGCGAPGVVGSSHLVRRLYPPSNTYPHPLNENFYVWHESGSPFSFLDGHVETRDYEYLVQASSNGPNGNTADDSFWGHVH